MHGYIEIREYGYSRSLEGIMDYLMNGLEHLNVHTENNTRFLFHTIHKNKLQVE